MTKCTPSIICLHLRYKRSLFKCKCQFINPKELEKIREPPYHTGNDPTPDIYKGDPKQNITRKLIGFELSSMYTCTVQSMHNTCVPEEEGLKKFQNIIGPWDLT